MGVRTRIIGACGVVSLCTLAAGRPANFTAAAAVVTGYQEVKDWPKLPPGVQLGEVPGVDIDAHGHVFVFHRPGRGFEPSATEVLADPAVLEIDAESGRLIASWGVSSLTGSPWTTRTISG